MVSLGAGPSRASGSPDLRQFDRKKNQISQPAHSTVGNYLEGNTWFDPAGQAIKQQAPGSESFAKTVYDSLGRTVKTYTGFDADEPSSSSLTYFEADDVSGDTIMQQTETVYDEAGNVTFTRLRQRLHTADDSETGELTTPGGADPKARVSYTAAWYDQIGRPVATADYGTNGGSEPTRLDSPPSSSDTVLDATTDYDSIGQVYQMTDPAGKITRREFDDAGRVVKEIRNYTLITGSSSSSSGGDLDKNITVTMTYTADGQTETLTAENSVTGNQTTTYVYGTDVGGIGEFRGHHT